MSRLRLLKGYVVTLDGPRRVGHGAARLCPPFAMPLKRRRVLKMSPRREGPEVGMEEFPFQSSTLDKGTISCCNSLTSQPRARDVMLRKVLTLG